jgi:DNA-binding transcriptional LysR family regulator
VKLRIVCFAIGNVTMDRLRCLQVFVEVARDGSFSGAARRLGMSKASVTKHIAWLEHALHARLLNRTTKQVGLTDIGLTTLNRARLLLDGYEEIEAGARESVREPRGVVRLGTPPSFGTHHLVPLVTAFAEQNPDIQIALSLDDGSANLVAHGLDLSVRIAPTLEDASYIAVPLVRVPQMLVAAPKYIDAHGAPKSLAELARHNCLVHSLKSPTSIWRFEGRAGAASVRVRGSIYSNFGEALKQAAILGHGISMHPTYMVADDIAAGRLVPVLPKHDPVSLDITVIYSTRQNLPLRVRRFVDFLKDWARTPPPWAAAAPPAVSVPRRRRAAQA